MLKYFLLTCVLGSAALAQPLTSQPIDPLLAVPLKMSSVTPQSATLQLTTRAALACVVVYGTDESFGQLALDQSMGASAHQDHLVNLRGLTPDTDYFYRVQGSDPQGTFYASDTLSFRTPPADETTSLGTNVATLEQGASVVAVSSEFSAAFAGSNAIDDDPSSEWSSQGDGNAAAITIKLAEPTEVTGFGLWTRTMGASAQINSFEVENEMGEVFGPFELPNASGIYTFPAEGRGQTFTFRVVDSSGGNTGVVEVAAYSQTVP